MKKNLTKVFKNSEYWLNINFFKKDIFTLSLYKMKASKWWLSFSWNHQMIFLEIKDASKFFFNFFLTYVGGSPAKNHFCIPKSFAHIQNNAFRSISLFLLLCIYYHILYNPNSLSCFLIFPNFRKSFRIRQNYFSIYFSSYFSKKVLTKVLCIYSYCCTRSKL